MNMFAWPTLWVYLMAQSLGGITAGASFFVLNPDDHRDKKRVYSHA